MTDRNRDFWLNLIGNLRELYSKKDGNFLAFEKEKSILEVIFPALEEKLSKDYNFIKILDRGGSGILFLVTHKATGIKRVIKIPRPLNKKLIESVQNERELLCNLEHPNLIRLYDLGDLKLEGNKQFDSYPYFAMEYIDSPGSLTEIIESQIKSPQNLHQKTMLESLMKKIIEILKAICDVISFLHQKDIIHYDIKPDNIFIDLQGRVILSDLGYSKKIGEKEEVIGFTYIYAHPTLLYYVSKPESINRIRYELIPQEAHKIYDIYAFGKTILEILRILNSNFSNLVGYDYNFIYLHLMACRMMDGQNFTQNFLDTLQVRLKTDFGIDYQFYKEEWLGLNQNDFDGIKYHSIFEIIKDFEKLNNPSFLSSIPELNFFNPYRIQSSYYSPAIFSPRIKSIIEHPIFSRLYRIPQLDFIQHIYPTATHNRFEHSIGTYRNCCLYILSLYNDAYNPLFRQLVDLNDLKALLLSALLHDLGHYPLAHIFEEVIKIYPTTENLKPEMKFIKHENFTVYLLSSEDSFGSNDRKSLKSVIEDEWNIKIDQVIAILRGYELVDNRKIRNIKHIMLHSIISGPIDVDKLDFLQRDSHNCFLKYGDLIDEDRLIRNLSIVIGENSEEKKKNLTIGVYERGKSAAESFIFARYLLFQSLYWHHTARAIRAMLYEAIIPVLIGKHKLTYTSQEDIIIKSPQDFYISLKELKEYGKNLSPYQIIDLIKENSDIRSRQELEVFKEQLKKRKKDTTGQKKIQDYQSFFKEYKEFFLQKPEQTIEDILSLVYERTNDEGRILIDLLNKRKYYKRIYTIHPIKTENELKDPFYKSFESYVLNKKKIFQENLAKNIMIKFQNSLTKIRRIDRSITLEESQTNDVVEKLREPLSIICDIPQIDWKIDEISLIPEPNKFRQNYETKEKVGKQISDVYHEIYNQLMIKTCKGRIYCHPDIRDVLLRVLTPKLIKECINETYNEMKV